MRNRLLKFGDCIYRVLGSKDELLFVINCIKQTMPMWIHESKLEGYTECTECELFETSGINLDTEELNLVQKKQMNEKFNIIADILPYISDSKMRNAQIKRAAQANGITPQTVRKYLCAYLAYQNKAILLGKQRGCEKELSADEKNMRWALNKYFYTKNKNSLNTAYTFMLRDKYCDENGKLLQEYPSFYQFRYFYRKTKKLQNYYISRDGIKDYQRNRRPLLGGGVQLFAHTVGKGMVDSTVCDIYLLSDSGELVGRPVLTACVDVYSGLCMGYSLSWEGGIYSVRRLLMNIISDKVKWCDRFGIKVSREDWNCDSLPSTLITDMGSEYRSENVEQLSELGVTIVNLPSYRPELKGCIEKFFDVIQSLYKPQLKGKGVISPDFRERGAHDYRKDACLTIDELERIILHCIVYYNSKRALKGFPYTEELLTERVKPYSSSIWNRSLKQGTANLIKTDKKQIMLTMLPRTQGKFSRFGLRVGRMHYKCEGYTEKYLTGETAAVAYNPENVSEVWVIEKGIYVKFDLIEERFADKSVSEVEEQYKAVSSIVNENAKTSVQAQIDLSRNIEIIAGAAQRKTNCSIKNIRSTRQKEKIRTHTLCFEEGEIYE